MSNWRHELRDQLKRHEGWVPHAYRDHLGFWTIGYGRLIDPARGGGLSLDEGEYLLRNDIEGRIATLRSRLAWFDRLPDRKKQALTNMAFQLGVNGLLGFRRMLHALQNRQWSEARREALDSRWAKQTPVRAREIANMLGEEE